MQGDMDIVDPLIDEYLARTETFPVGGNRPRDFDQIIGARQRRGRYPGNCLQEFLLSCRGARRVNFLDNIAV